MAKGNKSLFFRIRWFRILLLLSVPLYFVGVVKNAERTAGELEPVAEAFHRVHANCIEKTESVGDATVSVLDCGGAYDHFIEARDEVIASRGCWNSERWVVFNQGSDRVTSAPISVWCYSPWPF